MGKARRTAVTIEFASKTEAVKFLKYASDPDRENNEPGKLNFYTVTPDSDNPDSFGGYEADDYTDHVAKLIDLDYVRED